jgi:outer membrane immunogenic protein
MSRSILAAVVTALSLAAPALAADIPGAAPRMAAVAPPAMFNWTGVYLGVNAGYGRALASTNAVALGTTTLLDSGRMGGAIGGGQLGANWQLGAVVLGIEGDLQWSGQKQTTVLGAITETDRISSFGTARGRLGYAFDRWMLYGTAGAGWGNYRTQLTVPALGTATYSSSRVGYAAGAGMETALASNWTAKLEYLYLDTGKVSSSTGLPGLTLNTQVRDHVIRVGVNYLIH